MKKTVLHFIFCFCIYNMNAQLPQLDWARSCGDSFNDMGACIAKDASGNVYTAGYFGGTVDFDPGPGTYTLTAAGGFDCFVMKLDASGNFVWAKGMGGSGHDFAWGIAVDLSGNVYTTGSFLNGGDFDPGPSTYSFTSLGFEDVFVSKLNSLGNFVWAKQMGGTSGDIGQSIKIAGGGNVIVGGYFGGSGDFDPGVGVTTLTSAGGEDIFISTLTATGNFIWAKQMGGTGNDNANSIAVDAAGSVYSTGSFQSTADLDPGAGVANLTSAGSYNVFVSKLDLNGNYVWAKAMGGTFADIGFGITADLSGGLYIAGSFIGISDYDPNAGVFNLSSTGQSDIFVCKLNSSGNFVYAKNMGSAFDDEAKCIEVDAAGNVFLGGYYGGISDMDPGSATYTLNCSGPADVFISKFDATGNFLWAEGMGSVGYDYALGITVDPTGSDIYTTGFFQDTVDFDPFVTTYTLAATATDIFVHKMVPSTVGIHKFSNKNGVTVFPNPASHEIFIEHDLEINKIIVCDMLGEMVLSQNGNNSTLNIKDLKNGVYILKCYSEKGVSTFKFIKE